MTNLALEVESGRLSAFAGELRKLPAFARRDFLVALSYRTAFVSDLLGLVAGAVMFYFVGLLVDPTKLPEFGGSRASYLEFVAAGIALGAFVQFGLGRVGAALHTEQLMGTLESLLMTPTSTATIQFGSVVYDLIYMPIRTALFLFVIAVAFGLDFEVGGAVPATLALLAFVPFVWGLGMFSAAATLTFRRGAGVFGIGVVFMMTASGAFFPLDLLPGWIETVARFNPVTIAVDAIRQPLLAGADWQSLSRDVLTLLPMSCGSLAAGILAFRLAMRRERGRGTLGLY